MSRSFGTALRGAVLALVLASAGGCSWMELPPPDGALPAESAPASRTGGIAAVHIRVAFNALKNRDFIAAERLFRKAHDEDPAASQPLAGLGLALYGQRRYADAADAYRDALAREPDHSGAQDGLAKSLISQGKYGAARELLEAVAQKAPNAAIFNKLGVARDLSGDGEGAQQAYRAALNLQPGNLSARNNLALSLAVSGKYADAVAEMAQVVADPKASPRHRGNLAFIHGLAGDMAAMERVSGTAGGQPDQDRFNRMRELAKAGERAKVLDMLARGEEGVAEGTGTASSSTSETAANTTEKKEKSPSDAAVDKAAAVADGASPSPAPEAVAAEPATPAPAPAPTAATAPQQVIAALPSDTASEKSENVDNKLDIKDFKPVPVTGHSEETATTPSQPADAPADADKPQSVAAVAVPRPALPRPGQPEADAATGGPGGAEAGVWRVQLAAYRTLFSTRRGREILMQGAGGLLPGLEALTRRSAAQEQAAEPPPARIEYRLRTPVLADRAAAVALCKALQTLDVPCLAVRQPEGLWIRASFGGAGDAAEKPAAAGWRVQVAAYRSRAHAERGYGLLMAKAGDLLTGLEGLRSPGVEVPATKTVPAADYRLRTPGLKDRAAATTLCNALQERGISCLVIRHADEVWQPAT